MLSNTIYGLMIFMFITLLGLLVCSDDFLNLSFVSDSFIYWLFGDLVFFLGFIFLFGYKYYRLAMNHLETKGKEVSAIISELNRDSSTGFRWELGEHGLWIGLTKDDLVFVNDCPEDLDNEIELDEGAHAEVKSLHCGVWGSAEEGDGHSEVHFKKDHAVEEESDEETQKSDHGGDKEHSKHGHH